jgi:hypothetical protein
MSNVSGINGSNYYPVDGTNGTPFMSSDALLEYCQMQLGGLDGEVDNEMKGQELQLREREAVESAEHTINSFGTDGPQSGADMDKCVKALNDAIGSLPPGDPVAAQLQQYEKNITSNYGYSPAQPLTADQQAQLAQAQQVLAQPTSPMYSRDGGKTYSFGAPDLMNASFTVQQLQAEQTSQLTKPPNKDQKEWQGDMDALSNIADDVKSNAEIQMLKLQDLVSQRQQAVQLVSGMMSKTDQTLEDLAKAIGH